MQISNAGLVAYLQVSLGSSASLGFSFSASFYLQINTTSSTATLDGVQIPTGFEVQAQGSMTLAGVLNLSGTFTLQVNSGSLQIYVSANVSVIGINFTVTGFAGIYYDGSPGIAFSLQLSVGSNTSYTISLLPGLFDISGSFILDVNTTSITRNGISPGLLIAINNLSIYMFGFNVSGTISISVNSSGFDVTVPSSNPLTLSFFGIITLSVSGFLDVSFSGAVSFSFTATASFSFGDSWFGLSASLSFSVWDDSAGYGFSVMISGTVYIIGISFGATAGVTLNNGDLSLTLGVSIQYWWLPDEVLHCLSYL